MMADENEEEGKEKEVEEEEEEEKAGEANTKRIGMKLHRNSNRKYRGRGGEERLFSTRWLGCACVLQCEGWHQVNAKTLLIVTGFTTFSIPVTEWI